MYNIVRKAVFGGNMDAQLKKGLLEVCVLSAIKKEESYGYKIISDLAPYVEISESTLYPILRRLEQSGAVKTRCVEFNGRLRRYFSITEIGKAKIAEFLLAMEQFEKIKAFIRGE
jgi:PadR family transcriptional regulator PadR